MCGSGCVLSTADDMAKWMLFHLNGGKTKNGKQLLRKSSLSQSHSPQLRVSGSTISKYYSRPMTPVTLSEDSYGMGWKTGYYRGRMQWHLTELYLKKCVIVLWLRILSHTCVVSASLANIYTVYMISTWLINLNIKSHNISSKNTLASSLWTLLLDLYRKALIHKSKKNIRYQLLIRIILYNLHQTDKKALPSLTLARTNH